MKPIFVRAGELQPNPISIAFVGAGPTAIYAIQSLLKLSESPFKLKVFEKQKTAGRGTPYRPGWNDPAMLSNIPSIELPPIGPSLIDWLRSRPSNVLKPFGISHSDLNDRAFYPRLLLGLYMKDGFDDLVEKARRLGLELEVCAGCHVKDIVPGNEKVALVIAANGKLTTENFDYVVLATGHQWPEHPEVKPGYFASPWPASALSRIGPTKVGIRGASLTAIDAVVALATRHGVFVEHQYGRVSYKPNAGTQNLAITMMSRKGLLPEADFYGPIPYTPLDICTPEAIAALIASSEDMLDRTFALFKKQLEYSDPDYASEIGLAELSLEDFHDRYFEQRLKHDPFEWARKNLAEAQSNYARHHTVPWRYAILRMHEVVEPLVPHLENSDYERFTRYFKPVFVDDYATIPHKSVKRLLALHETGKLKLRAVGDDYRIDNAIADCGADIILGRDRLHFPVFIDATGQRGLLAKDFPFPSLISKGQIRDVVEEPDGPRRGIAVDDRFHPIARSGTNERLFCVSLPFILGSHPFHQGLTSAHEMGEEVGRELAAILVNQGTMST